MDDLLLLEVDHEVDDLELEPGDDANLITSVEVTNEWTNFRQNFADDMYAKYLVRHAKLEM